MMKNKRIWWLIALTWCILIALATRSVFFTGDSTEQLLSNPFFDSKLLNIFARKTVHVIAFGMLAIFFICALRGTNYQYILAWALATLYGAIDEWHQTFIPNRDGILSDVILNSIGAIVALICFYLVHSWYTRDRK